MERARLRLFLEALPSWTDKFEYREPRPPSAPYPKLPPTSEVLSHKQVQSFEGDESYLAGIQKQLEALSSEVGLDLTSNSIHSYVMAWANDESRKSHQDYSEGLSDHRNIFPRQIDVDSFLRRVRDFPDISSMASHFSSWTAHKLNVDKDIFATGIHRAASSPNEMRRKLAGENLKPSMPKAEATMGVRPLKSSAQVRLPKRTMERSWLFSNIMARRRNVVKEISVEEARPKRVLFCSHGSRGDVQPLISLAEGMVKQNYEVAFWTARPVDVLIRSRGFKCFVHDLDTEALMRRTQIIMHKSKIFDNIGRGLGFFAALLEATGENNVAKQVETIPDSVLAAHLEYRPDITITSLCMPAISCAEALHIPVVLIAFQPMFPTKDFPPFAFHAGRFKKENSWMHKPLGNLFLDIYEHQTCVRGVRRCRELAGLPEKTFADGTPMVNLRFVPTCNAISSRLVPQPDDWPRWQRVCGFLIESPSSAVEVVEGNDSRRQRSLHFSIRRSTKGDVNNSLDGSTKTKEKTSNLPASEYNRYQQPSIELVDFIKDGSKPIYIGFGSMCGEENFATEMTRTCLQSLMNNGLRGILLGGWAGLTRERLDSSEDRELISYAERNVFEVPACSHVWLFPRCSAVVHHGGAGTLAIGLRSSCPTVVCPFIFDQEYFGELVRVHGCGVVTAAARNVTVKELSTAINTAVTDQAIRRNVEEYSKVVAGEDGIANAIDFIEEVAGSFPFPWPIRLSSYRRDESAWFCDSEADQSKDGKAMERYFERQQLDRVALTALLRSPLAKQMKFMFCNDTTRIRTQSEE